MNRDKFKVLLHFSPVYKIWRLIKKTRVYAHKGKTAAKALIRYIRWNLKEKKQLYRSIEKADHLKPFRPLRWKHKVCYLTGESDGKAVFIKTGGEVNTTAREAYAITYAAEHSDCLKKHLPRILSYSENYIMEEFIQGKALTPNEETAATLYEIYEELKRLDILHLDLRPDNFMVKEDGTIVLIDFGFALVNSRDVFHMIEKTKKAKEIIKNLGSDFAPRNGTLDDAYSMLLTIKTVCPSLMQKRYDIWRTLNEDTGMRAVEVS